MAAKTLEEVIKIVEEQQKKIQRLEDIHEIANLMGRYIYFHEVHRDPEFPDIMFAKKTPGVSWEVARSGVFSEGGIRRMLEGDPDMDRDAIKKGSLFTHPLTTPVIEVAGDGKTGKGVWISPGYETGMDKNGKPISCWCYIKYGCDFVKEDGQWKLWHYHVYRVFMTPWNIPFTDEWEKNVRDKEPMPFGWDPKPDFPTTYDHPYSVDTARELMPAPPEPYETFSETFSYGMSDK